MRPLAAFVLLLTLVVGRAADFDTAWTSIASSAQRRDGIQQLLEQAAEPGLSSSEKLTRLWKIYLIAQTADEHRAILREAATINDVAARMLVGVYRFNDFHDTLAKDQSAANKAQLKLLHDGQETLNYKDLAENGYDTSFVFDRWEDKSGITGRWVAGDAVLDASPRPFGTYHARLTRPGEEPVTLAGITKDQAVELRAPGVSASLTKDGGELIVNDDRRSLIRTPSGKTPGAEKPADALTLFDGKNTDAFQPTKWKIGDDGAIAITRGSGGLTTKEKFEDMRLHLEFRQAFNPDTVGGRRGNSGVMLMDFYEIALSDNFADPPQIKANGAIYGVAAPKVNASAAPLEWQSLLVDFTAPRFDAAGKKIAGARITAWQNGQLIHDDVEIVTPWEKNKPEPTEPAPLQLQQHGSCLQFRNIWAVKKVATRL